MSGDANEISIGNLIKALQVMREEKAMNANVESAECNHGMCGACRYEDCACDCHLIEEHAEAEVFEDDPTDLRGPGDEDEQ